MKKVNEKLVVSGTLRTFKNSSQKHHCRHYQYRTEGQFQLSNRAGQITTAT